jgi:predicted membrane channel-forming protein YqfA (hemolysin III family)
MRDPQYGRQAAGYLLLLVVLGGAYAGYILARFILKITGAEPVNVTYYIIQAFVVIIVAAIGFVAYVAISLWWSDRGERRRRTKNGPSPAA